MRLNDKIIEIKRISSKSFSNSHIIGLKIRRILANLIRSILCTAFFIQYRLVEKSLNQNSYLNFRLSVCQGMVKREIREWIPGIIFVRAIQNLNEPSRSDENYLKLLQFILKIMSRP